jgi:hypothetical protein
LVINL